MEIKNLFAASATAICLASGAFASTLGFAVTDEGVLTPAAAGPAASAAEEAALLGAANASGTNASASDIIGFFIPLDTTPTDVVVAFAGVDGGSSFLNVFFEDLDLIGANDPTGFFEQVVISSDSNVLATITDIDALGIFGMQALNKLRPLTLAIYPPVQTIGQLSRSQRLLISAERTPLSF